MRINSVDDTNFKMALKLNPKKMPHVLKQKPVEYTNSLNEFGEKIKNIKLYNVVFEDSLVPQVKSINLKDTKDYFQALKSEEEILGKWYEVPQGDIGDTAGGFYPDEPKIFRTIYGKDAADEYKKFKKLSIYEQAGELSRLLEERDIKKYMEEARKKSAQRINNIMEEAKQKNLEEKINDLMDKYSYAKHEAMPEEKTTGLFKRLFSKLFS